MKFTLTFGVFVRFPDFRQFASKRRPSLRLFKMLGSTTVLGYAHDIGINLQQ